MKATGKGYQSETDIKGKPHRSLVSITHDSARQRQPHQEGRHPLECHHRGIRSSGRVRSPARKARPLRIGSLGDNGEETAEYCEKVSRLCIAAGCCQAGRRETSTRQTWRTAKSWWSGNVHQQVRQAGLQHRQFRLDVWGVNHPDVAAVPKNLDAIRLWNEARGVSSDGNGQAAGGNGNGHHAAATVGWRRRQYGRHLIVACRPASAGVGLIASVWFAVSCRPRSFPCQSVSVRDSLTCWQVGLSFFLSSFLCASMAAKPDTLTAASSKNPIAGTRLRYCDARCERK